MDQVGTSQAPLLATLLPRINPFTFWRESAHILVVKDTFAQSARLATLSRCTPCYIVAETTSAAGHFVRRRRSIVVVDTVNGEIPRIAFRRYRLGVRT